MKTIKNNLKIKIIKLTTLLSIVTISSCYVNIHYKQTKTNLLTSTTTSETIPAKRGKVNEIDFCMAPSDVSLSRYYKEEDNNLSLTRALNDATNRAVRRILLSKSWPSSEALNRSLRMVLNKKDDESVAKCPVPRPILNIIMRRSNKEGSIPKNKRVLLKSDLLTTKSTKPTGKRTNEEWVSDQLIAFQSLYGKLPGYNYAESYLESILSLATTNQESSRVGDVLKDGVYDESYKRLLSVLKSAGVELVEDNQGRKRIGETLSQMDICLSVMDKIQMKNIVPVIEYQQDAQVETKSFRFPFFKKEEELKPEDLGGVLLSSSEPSMTRQLNALSNIVQRTLLFGGDDEILVLAETLEADIPAFQQRWNDNTSQQLGYEYLLNLIQLLRDCYSLGVVSNLDPPLPLSSTSYSNSYERLMANLVQGGSGYIKPKPNLSNEYFYNTMIPKNAQDEFGRFALWETSLRRKQDRNKPKGITLTPAYPDDLIGNWTVADEIGGKIIGSSTIGLLANGQIQIFKSKSSTTGLRWRLDAGPTHLDTVTFQVVSDDGAILQYKGFIDRGARLESRFSKRAISIRGAVTFLMRDADVGKGSRFDVDTEDLLPLDFRIETTRFKMTKIV